MAVTDPAVDAGLREQRGRWRLAMDPGAFAVGAPDMPQLLARSRAPVTLARGELHAMSTGEQLTRLGVPTVTLPGLGHNAHVESPSVSIALLDPHRHATTGLHSSLGRAARKFPHLPRIVLIVRQGKVAVIDACRVPA